MGMRSLPHHAWHTRYMGWPDRIWLKRHRVISIAPRPSFKLFNFFNTPCSETECRGLLRHSVVEAGFAQSIKTPNQCSFSFPFLPMMHSILGPNLSFSRSLSGCFSRTLGSVRRRVKGFRSPFPPSVGAVVLGGRNELSAVFPTCGIILGPAEVKEAMEALREVLTGGKVRVLGLARVPSGVKRSLSDFFANGNGSADVRLPTSATFCFPLKDSADDGGRCGVPQ